MRTLKKLLSDSAKARRHRRTLLNMQITILAWLVEFLGFVVIFLGAFLLGHENSIVTLSLQTITVLIFLLICPSIYLMNSYHMKNLIAESRLYFLFRSKFSCCNPEYQIDQDDEEDEIHQEENPMNIEDQNEPVNIDNDTDEVQGNIEGEGTWFNKEYKKQNIDIAYGRRQTDGRKDNKVEKINQDCVVTELDDN